jgi:glycerophosphoryl diester phosphodiesterase
LVEATVNVTRRILAHRGLWQGEHGNQNTLVSLTAALEAGFGVETDLRDADERIVLSHDPAQASAPSLAEWLQKLKAEGITDHGPLALNIKSDGLSNLLPKQDLAGIDHFYFDMSTPQWLRFRAEGLTVASRVSEFEPIGERPQRDIWLDAFTSDWFLDSERLFLEQLPGHRIFVVSPELHGRDKGLVWEWYSNLVQNGADAYLCTDFPEEALNLL